MSLRHAILGIVSARPMTGYELIRTFANSVAYTWAAGQAQIYPELHKMEREGLLTSQAAARGASEKRIYAMTEAGEDELRRWVEAPTRYPAERDVARLRATYLEFAPATSRAFFEQHLAHYSASLERLEARQRSVDERSGPLLRARLANRPAAEHAAIIAFKAHGVKGQIARAQAEIAWAREGIALVDSLAERVSTAGSSNGVPDEEIRT
jgi:DNA-binding PadR family transcriptional regulator